jgi:cytoskeletal protein RodZ
VSIVNVTTSKQAEKLAEIGAQFKRIREDKDLSIPHLTATTLISERYLRAIEAGEIGSLPEPVYVRGFIRKYGDALGVGDLSEDFPLESVLPQQKWAGSAAAELRPLHLYALYVGVIAGAVSLLATFLNSPEVGKISDGQTSFSKAAQVVSASTKANKSPEILPDALPKIGGLEVLRRIGANPSVVMPTVNVSPVNVPVETRNQDIAKPNSATPKSNLSNLLSTWANVTAASESSSLAGATISPNGDFAFVGNKPVNVGLVMKGESWVRITIDGKTEFEGILNEGKKVAWSGDRQVSIRAGNASSVALTYNNQPMQLLGKEGEVTEKLFGANQTANLNNTNLRTR